MPNEDISKRDSGFTVIEALVVLVIFGLTGAILAARGPAHSLGLEARDAASEIMQALRLGRSRAIAADRPVAVRIDLRMRLLFLEGQVPSELPAAVKLAAALADGSVPRDQAVFVFAADGSANGGYLTVVAGSQKFGITVDWLTGRVALNAS
jgi:general secretion pathway protein H